MGNARADVSWATARTFAVAPTPFADNGAVDAGSIDRLAAFYEQIGIEGIVVLGHLGEASKLDVAEAIEVSGRFASATSLPVVAGVSAPGFAAMRHLTHAAMDAGAAGVMVAPHSGLRSDEQILAFFDHVRDAIGSETPFVLQDHPLITSVVLTAATIATIVRESPNLVMLKHEDWPGLDKISQLRDLEANGAMRSLPILCGNGGLFLDLELERGADGAMTGYCFPELLVELVRLHDRGEPVAVHDLMDDHLPLLRYEHQPAVGLAARKYVLRRRGILASDRQRSPAAALSANGTREVEQLLARLTARRPDLALA